jgi:hypothetical protein
VTQLLCQDTAAEVLVSPLLSGTLPRHLSLTILADTPAQTHKHKQGVHKILKKHDKLLPHSPCRQFYIAHLHQQPWVQGTYRCVLWVAVC